MNPILRVVFIIYFVTHIPITLTLDLQVIFGKYYPEALQQLFSWYCTTHNDQILLLKPVWLKSFIWAECLFQLPFFFAASYALIYKKNWIRIPSIIYGAHVATTVWALLAEFVYHDNILPQQKLVLFSFYAPYFVIPALLMLYMAAYRKPFGEKSKKTKTK
ncbi:transmembrane protein 6/97 [Ochromonadaceae sp. CCMP2298]|nr:transmembrane protein 6/97 [Ochromonadaceae sp. CCMP2298]|mmetsp:Transcript_30848/g.68113  ORF Transcript_30848/g.68113 Transcript_30848/m.68113 type:complete len:161 (+) Transcript_30848:112-594(+)|eukprot:CAMPEP_0173183324 /NCGR_PEP_ID=MMETSP1141-20130122/8327_1 /TAXON_ID=483371 /ORGANISM="non described non described, Strain CCMP2298" /LENGTH=160 /DNA_ID=CAMNT_0014106511 /DNA_START=79 /DNA_END=561 /DNA_ORIENTATION=+